MTTIYSALTDRTRELGDQPAVVFADARTGERTELGFATLYNWTSKTANLWLDAFDAGLGSEVRVDLPLHWLVPVVLLATWTTGACVRLEPGGDVVVSYEEDPGEDPDVVIGAGMGGRPTTPPSGDVLTVADILAQPDEFVDDPGDEGAWAFGGRTQATLLAEGPISEGATRVLWAGDRPTADLVFLTAHTLPHGIGLVLARHHDDGELARLAEHEQVG